MKAKVSISPLTFFSEEFTFVHTSSLILVSLEKGMCISYHILLPNKHVCTRYPAAFLRGNLALQDPLLLLS